jgi:hypothetical protein
VFSLRLGEPARLLLLDVWHALTYPLYWHLQRVACTAEYKDIDYN